MTGWRACALALGLWLGAGPGLAQGLLDYNLGQTIGAGSAAGLQGIRTIDEEMLFQNSAFGQRVLSEIEAASRALEVENTALLEMLTEREIQLTELRATMLPQEFRAAADAFDREAEMIRREQGQKRERLLQFEASEQRRFFALATPVLRATLERDGAQVLIDARAIILGAEGIDITEAALDAIDAALGDGAPAPFPLNVP
jgi:Skp family chaperone for outer membrane proteins